jgi:hypothetical protein
MSSGCAPVRDPRRTIPWALWLGFTAIVGWRLLLLARDGEPVGVDMANWLRIFRSWGGDVTVDDVLVPPLVPLLTGLADLALGTRWASWLVPSLASVAPAVGVWVVARRRAPAHIAALGALGLALVHPTATAFAWGGVPQLLGLGLAPIALAATVRATERPARRTWAQAGALFLAVAMTSTLITTLLVVALGVAVLVALTERGVAVLRGAGWAALVALPAAALYVPILLRMSLYSQRATAVTGEVALRSSVGQPLVLWVGLLAIAAAVPLLLEAGRERTSTAALVTAAVVGLWLGDVRFAALVPTATVLAMTSLAAAAWRGTGLRALPFGGSATGARIVVAVQLAALLVLASAGMRTQPAQVEFYAQLVPPGILEDAALIDAIERGDAAVAVASVAGAPTGWWLEAVGIDALVASRPDWLAFPEERRVAALTVALFSAPAWPTPTTAAEACALGAPWLYVPHVWRGIDPSALARELAARRLLEVEHTTSARVLRSAAC